MSSCFHRRWTEIPRALSLPATHKTTPDQDLESRAMEWAFRVRIVVMDRRTVVKRSVGAIDAFARGYR